MDAPVFSTNTDSCADTRKRKLDDTSETAHKITDTADNAAPPKVANVQRQIQRQATPPQQERHAADTGRRGIENINSSSNSNVSNSNVSNSNSSGSYPALPPSTGNVAEDEALQGLLMAWYYSGYATGRYQALKDLGYYDTCGGGNSTAATVDGAACTGGTCAAAAAAVEREEGGAGGVCSGGETSTS